MSPTENIKYPDVLSLQMGGNVIIDQKGVIALRYRSVVPADRPTAHQILKVLEVSMDYVYFFMKNTSKYFVGLALVMPSYLYPFSFAIEA